jgi:hypothetical protein
MGSRRVVLGLGRAHYGGEFDAAGDDTGRQGILSQGMPPTCGFGDEAPYAVAIIRLDDGVKITAQVVDCDPESLAIGDRVRREFRRLQQDGESGILCYGYKFVPLVTV